MMNRTDIIFNSIENDIQVLVAEDNAGEQWSPADFESFLVSPDEDPSCKLPNKNELMSSPHSTSFLDLNGDCQPDIFMQR